MLSLSVVIHPKTKHISSFPTLEVSSYLLAEAFLSKCLSVLELSPGNCQSYLSLAQDICCVELKRTVFTYLSRNLLELPHLIKYVLFWLSLGFPIVDHMFLCCS